MKALPLLGKIKARDGCIIYFPSRTTKNVISGREKTRRRFGEEWIQFSLDHIEAEVRLEGDNAISMGDILKADLIAKLVTRIDDSQLDDTASSKGSLDKVMKKFRCSTTSDLSVILGKSFFQPKIKSILLEALYEILHEASYKKLLTDSTHRDQLQKKLMNIITPILIDSGFLLIDCSIQRFAPINPGIIGVEKEIADLWFEWEKQQKQLEAEKEFIESELEEEKKRRITKAKQETEKYARSIELEEQEALKEYEENIKEFEIGRANIRKDKDLKIAEINEEAKEKHREYQQKEIDFKIGLEDEEIARKRKIEEDEISNEFKKERDKINHEADMRKKEMEGLSEKLKQYNLKEQISQIKARIDKLEGFLKANLLEANIKAQNSYKKDLLESESKILKEILNQLPKILSSIPIDKDSKKTIIQFSGESKIPTGTNGIAVMYWPIIKDLVDTFTKKYAEPEAYVETEEIKVDMESDTEYDDKSDDNKES